MSFNEAIRLLLERPLDHGRLVNTLSMLEYIGARKILKSQDAETVSMRTLAHAAEEIRHARILKGLALQLSDGRLKHYSEDQLLCGSEARTYFQSIDHACAEVLNAKNARKNYALTTLLIEERAMRIYPEYETILRSHGIPNALKAIIKDEDKHLFEVRAEIRAETREELGHGFSLSAEALLRLRSFEEAQFDKFIESVAITLKKSGVPSQS